MIFGVELSVRLVFDQKQSCIEPKAQFNNEANMTSNKRLRLFMRFYVMNVVVQLDDKQYRKVTEEKVLPPELAACSNTRK